MSPNINILIASYLSGNISSEDQRALNDWLKESEANRMEFQRAKKLWEVSLKQKTQNTYDSSEAWNQFLELNHKNGVRSNVIKYRYHQVAAAVLLLIAGAFVLTIALDKKELPVQTSAISTAFIKPNNAVPEVAIITLHAGDSVASYSLPDGSNVRLDKNSILEYPKNFKEKTRVTTLSGGAFFEVVRVDSVPFIVNCERVSVKVLGTSFSVKSTDHKKVIVSVASGTVELSDEKLPGKKMILQKNEKGTVSQEAPFFSKERINKKEAKLKQVKPKIKWQEN